MALLEIPRTGRDADSIVADLEAFRQGDVGWKEGKVFSLVYNAGDAHTELLKRAHNAFFSENGLNPMAFKSLQRMEAELVRMTATMLHGGPGVVGTLTSGGTESILLAVKAARERGKKKGIRNPEMVVPRSVHVAFDKAAHYLGVKIRHVALAGDYRVDTRALARAITRSTVLIAASAPQYPHGVIDPIEPIAALARSHDIAFHVDSCIGGFVLPWIEGLGYPVPPWDFRVDGVTSISADLHKYGYAAKGASVLVYRDMSYLKHQFFVATDWPGGIYASPTMPGTRPGGAIAAAWAAVHGMGQDGYLRHARRAMEARAELLAGLRAIPELRVLGEPQSTIVAYASRSRDVDIYAVADALEDRGWSVDRQQRPDSIHCTLMSAHRDIMGSYLADLREAVAHVRSHPELKSRGNAAMYGMMAKVPFRGMVRSATMKFMESMYGPGGASPDLSAVSEGQGPLMRAVNRYGPRALHALDQLKSRLDEARKRLLRREG